MKKTSGPSGPSSDRYTLLLSDGAHTQKAMLATELNPLVEERGLCAMCGVRLVDYISNTVGSRRVIIINEMELLASPEEMGGKQGNPVPVEEAAQKMQNSQPQAGGNTNTVSSMPLSPAGMSGAATPAGLPLPKLSPSFEKVLVRP